MTPVKVFIIDANPIVRQRLENVISQSSEIDITKISGFDELPDIKDIILESNPDILLLGIDNADSPEMKLFNDLRNQLPLLPILIMTPHTPEGAEIAVSALKKGAVEFFPKTSMLSGFILTEDFFKNRIIPVIKIAPRLNRNVLLTHQHVEHSVKSVEPISPDFFTDSLGRMELLVIAGCLGGIAPLYLLLSSLPENLPVPVIVVQHMLEIYSKVLAEDLNKYTALEVTEARDGDELKPGHVYIAPGDYHVLTNRKDKSSFISLYHGPKVAGFRPSIDLMLKSAAQQFGKRILAVYLSGGGMDGIEGAKTIDIIGGQIIIQNQHTSLLSDIPWKVESYGINDGSYPVERLGYEISKRLA